MGLMCLSFVMTDCFPFASNALASGPNQVVQYETASCFYEKTQETNSKQSTVIMLSVTRSSIDGCDKMTESRKCIICTVSHCFVHDFPFCSSKSPSVKL